MGHLVDRSPVHPTGLAGFSIWVLICPGYYGEGKQVYAYMANC